MSCMSSRDGGLGACTCHAPSDSQHCCTNKFFKSSSDSYSDSYSDSSSSASSLLSLNLNPLKIVEFPPGAR